MTHCFKDVQIQRLSILCSSTNSLVPPQHPQCAITVAANPFFLLTDVKLDSMHQEAPCLVCF